MRYKTFNIQREQVKSSIKLEIQSFIDKKDSLDYYKGFMMGLMLNNLITMKRYYALIRLSKRIEKNTSK